MLPVFKFSRIIGIFPIKILFGSAIKCIKSKFLFYYSNFIILFLILHSAIFYYGPFLRKILDNISSPNNMLFISINIFFNAHLNFMFYFIFKCHSNFSRVFQQLHICETIVKFKKSSRNKILIIFTVYLMFPALSFINKSKIFYNMTFLSFNDSIVVFLIETIQISVEFQFFSFCYVLFLLFEEINHILKNTPVMMISKRRINELRFAFGTLHELNEEINHIYGICIILFLCISNVSIQYYTFEIIKFIFNLLYNMNVNLNVRLVLRTCSILSRIFLLFWTCNRLESEVSKIT
jgi:hypothetical protein